MPRYSPGEFVQTHALGTVEIMAVTGTDPLGVMSMYRIRLPNGEERSVMESSLPAATTTPANVFVRSVHYGIVQILEHRGQDPLGALSLYRVRLPSRAVTDISEQAPLDMVPAPLLGTCVNCPSTVQIGCFCPTCNGPHCAKVFDFDQAATIAQPELAAYGQGACLAISMQWLKHRKQYDAIVSNAPTFVATLGSSALRTTLATWMAETQDNVLGGLFQQPAPVGPYTGATAAGRFVHHHSPDRFQFWSGPDADSDVTTVRGQLNNAKAYAFRLEQMSRWARANGLALYDARFDFPPPHTPVATWAGDACTYISQAGGGCGVIALTGPNEGHALAYMIQNYHGTRYYRLFDPNEGEWVCPDLPFFTQRLQALITADYNDLNEHWWVCKFD